MPGGCWETWIDSQDCRLASRVPKRCGTRSGANLPSKKSSPCCLGASGGSRSTTNAVEGDRGSVVTGHTWRRPRLRAEPSSWSVARSGRLPVRRSALVNSRSRSRDSLLRPKRIAPGGAGRARRRRAGRPRRASRPPRSPLPPELGPTIVTACPRASASVTIRRPIMPRPPTTAISSAPGIPEPYRTVRRRYARTGSHSERSTAYSASPSSSPSIRYGHGWWNVRT